MEAINKLRLYLGSIDGRLNQLEKMPNNNLTEIKVEIQTLQEVKSDISVIVMQLENMRVK